MLFSSPEFIVFFLLYFALHLITPSSYRIYLIIVGSTVFYGYWNPAYIPIPYALAAIAYALGSRLERNPLRARNRSVAIGVVTLLSVLFYFKYAHFFWNELARLLSLHRSTATPFTLPLGISFVTFTLIAYLIDVGRGTHRAEPKFSRLLACVLFFPHLISGPIVRPSQLIPLLRSGRFADKEKIIFGITLFSVGLIKKLVIADRLAAWINPVYSTHAVQSAVHYWLAMYAFSVQIYCDFSGYTDMALGVAYIIGVKLPTNFDAPYASASLIDFWRRWHITLSNWLRDYLYIPLGGNRFGFGRQLLNMFVTMVLGGLWHGANWTFVCWGALHGMALGLNHLSQRFAGKWKRALTPRWLSTAVTFHFVTFAWVFFRAPDLNTAWAVLRGAFTAPWTGTAAVLSAQPFDLVLILVFLVLHRWDRHQNILAAIRRVSLPLLWSVVTAGWLLAVGTSSGSSAEFIYFVF